MPARDTPASDSNGHAEPPTVDTIDPLTEAEALRSALAEAQTRAARLVAALKGYRKQHKTVTSALASLRSLRLD